MRSSDNGDFDGDFDFGQLAENFSPTKQIIINLNQTDTALALKDKWDAKHPQNPCIIIDVEDVRQLHFRAKGVPSELSKIVSTKDDVFRIYVVGHGNYDQNVIGDKGKKVNFRDLATYLSDFVREKKAVINLVVCGGGRGAEASPHENTRDSFAAKLHRFLLALTGKNQLVVARTHVVGVNAAGKKVTTDLSKSWDEVTTSGGNPGLIAKADQIKKQPGSKIIITSESGQQKKLDAYYQLWKPKVLKQLSDALKQTKQPDKAKFLSEWLTKFESMDNQEIASTLESELQKKDSPLRLHSNVLTRLFKDANTFTVVQALVEEWHRINSSEHTFKDAQTIAEVVGPQVRG